MHTDPNSYGTGRDPRGRGNHVIPVILLILSCITVHALTLLYLNSRDRENLHQPHGLSLEEIPMRGDREEEVLRDNCGLGLELSDVSELQQQYWALPDGVYVEQIDTDSIAYTAGLRSGDLLLEIEDQTVMDPEDCLELLEEFCEEETLELVYYRDGEEHSLLIPMEGEGEE